MKLKPICFAIALLTSICTAQNGVPPARLGHLQHGINTSHWFSQVYDPKGYTREHFEAWTTAPDIALIKALGFDHIRLSVNPQPMFRSNQADQIPTDYLAYLDAAVKMIRDQGLAAVIDIHPDSDFKQKLSSDDLFVEQFADFWRALAAHYAAQDPDYVFFEILNEPEVKDPFRWYGIQSKVANAIREGAPNNTIIAAGARWSDNDDLVFLEPLRDRDVIYDFHFYEPHVFTHQGATWGVNYWHDVKGLAYPSNPTSAEKAAAAVPDAANRLQVLRYGFEHWDSSRIDMEIGQAAAWAKRWGVPLICDEFGAYRSYTDPSDRAAWIGDVRKSLEKHAIGWTMWDYQGGFSVVVKKDGRVIPDEQILKALGLKALP